MQTSFIPKNPVVTQGQPAKASSIGLFSLLAIVVFALAAIVSAGVFFYKGLLTKQLEEDKVTLERTKEAFDPQIINQLIRLDSRISASRSIMASHIALTPFFDFLSSITLQSVRFRDFEFTYLASDKIIVSMKGQAQSYASVALQSDLLTQDRNLRDVLIGDIALEPSGTIGFMVSAAVDPSLVSYTSTLSSLNQSQ